MFPFFALNFSVCFTLVLQAALFAIDLLFDKSYEQKPIFVRHLNSRLKSFVFISTRLTSLYHGNVLHVCLSVVVMTIVSPGLLQHLIIAS